MPNTAEYKLILWKSNCMIKVLCLNAFWIRYPWWDVDLLTKQSGVEKVSFCIAHDSSQSVFCRDHRNNHKALHSSSFPFCNDFICLVLLTWGVWIGTISLPWGLNWSIKLWLFLNREHNRGLVLDHSTGLNWNDLDNCNCVFMPSSSSCAYDVQSEQLQQAVTRSCCSQNIDADSRVPRQRNKCSSSPGAALHATNPGKCCNQL